MLFKSEIKLLKVMNKNRDSNSIRLADIDKIDKKEFVVALYGLEEKGFIKKLSPGLDRSYFTYELTIKGYSYIEYKRKTFALMVIKDIFIPVLISILISLFVSLK